MSQVWVALMMSPDLELWDLAGVYAGQYAAKHACGEDGDSIGYPIKEWVEVKTAGQDTFLQAFESRPAVTSGTFYRVELHRVHQGT